MSEITQKLGFDVSDALNAIKNLDASLSSLQTRFQSMGAAFGSFNSSGTAAAAAATKAGTAFRTDVAQGAQSAQASTERLTTSLSLLSRVVFTQQIVSGLRIIKAGFAEALHSETEFQTKIAEIRTILPTESVDSLADSLRGLSDEYNLPLLDVARSKYILLSSGFTSAADSTNILNAAFKLSKTGIADAQQSVSLLSGALNAYGASSSQAEIFAAKFFDAVKLGHLTVADLTSNLDKAAPAAAALGVPLDEILAQFTALSLAGVKTNQAATEINSILSALIKQSPEAAKAIAALGHGTDIRQVIKDFGGVVPVIKALVDQASGNPEVLAKIFPNVRSLREIFTLANDGFSRYEAHVKEINNFTIQDHVSVYAERVSGAAERVSSDANKIHNALDKAFGETIINAAHNLSDMVGGVDSLTAVISQSGPLLLGLGATLTALTVKFAAARLGAASFASAIGALALVPAAQGLGATIGGFLDNKLAESTSANLKKLESDNKSSLESFKQGQADKAKAAATSDQSRIASAARAATALAQITGQPFTQTKQNLPFDITKLEAQVKGPINSAAEMNGILSRAVTRAAELRAAQNTQNAGLQGIANTRGEVNQIVKDSDSRAPARQFPGADGLRANFDAFKAQFVGVSQQAKITDGDIAGLLKTLGELNKQAQGGGIQARIAFGPEVAQFATGIDKLKQLQTQSNGLKIDFSIGPNLQALQNFISLTTPSPAFQAAATATQQASDSAATFASNFEKAAQNAQKAAEAAQQAAAAGGAGGAGAEHEAFGGMITSHFAHGGQARGTDTVPAMLSPGEFVMNAKSTQKFYSQLTAMNADKPIYRAEGGPVSNTTINGGITINSSPNPQQTAREVMNMIRRESRRGSAIG